MGYLLYCILSSLENLTPVALVGVDGQPVFLVSHNGLSAAISRINQSNITPEISCILAYQRVVESFHCHPAVGGVIPMRYGCLFEEEPQIIRLLKERSRQYKALLKELEGCVEMGIRILISECGPPSPSRSRDGIGRRDSSAKHSNADKDLEGELGRLGPSKTGLGQGMRPPAPLLARRASRPEGWGLRPGGNAEHRSQILRNPQSAIRNPQSGNPGCAYLAARKAHYEQQEKFNKQAKEVIEQYRAAFNGLFLKCKTEFPSIGNFQSAIFNRQFSIVNLFPSIYFLLPRTSVDSFRKVFRRMSMKEPRRLLLSGPWPPYNFVQPDHIYGQESIFPSLYE